jgi:peptide/nickel transport system substrate-binding protein
MRKLTLSTVLAALFACNAASAATTIKIGVGDDPDQLDPALSRAFVARLVLNTFCGKLFDISPDLQVVPALATGYTWSDDALALTIKLRPNLRFADGEPLDGEAVKYNFERNLTLAGSLRKTELISVKSVDVIDPVTVRVNLKEPQAPLPTILTDRAGMMISPKAGKELGDKFGNGPVCAGPFKFVSRVAQARIIFEKSPTYWDAANVHIDRVEFTPVNDSTVRLANLQSGQFDLIERVSPTDVGQIKADSKLKLTSAPDIGYAYIQLNVGNGPRGKLLADPRLREAIDLSIDREALVKVAFDNAFIPGVQWVAPVSYYYQKDLPLPKRDVAKAKALLKEAGVPNLTFKLITRPDRDWQVPAQVVQAMLSESGINMIIDTQENVTGLNNGAKGDFDALMSFWSGRVDPDGNISLYNICGAAANSSGYCSEPLNKLLNEARQIVDPAARKKLYDEAAAIWRKDRPLLALWYRNIFIAHRATVQGFVPYPDGLVRLVNVKVQ